MLIEEALFKQTKSQYFYFLQSKTLDNKISEQKGNFKYFKSLNINNLEQVLFQRATHKC